MLIGLIAAANIMFDLQEISVALDRFTPPPQSLDKALAKINTITHGIILSDGQRPSKAQLAAVGRNLPLQCLKPVTDLLTFCWSWCIWCTQSGLRVTALCFWDVAWMEWDGLKPHLSCRKTDELWTVDSSQSFISHRKLFLLPFSTQESTPPTGLSYFLRPWMGKQFGSESTLTFQYQTGRASTNVYVKRWLYNEKKNYSIQLLQCDILASSSIISSYSGSYFCERVYGCYVHYCSRIVSFKTFFLKILQRVKIVLMLSSICWYTKCNFVIIIWDLKWNLFYRLTI